MESESPTERKRTSQFSYCQIGLIISGIVLAIAGALLVGFYQTLYTSIIHSNVLLGTSPDGNYNWAGQNWVKPLFNEHMKFYVFDVLNPDEVQYKGDKPIVTERGPYSYRQTDRKHNVSFSADHTRATYWNYRTWFWDKAYSCEFCEEDDLVTVPNMVMLGVLSFLKQQGLKLSPKILNLVFMLTDSRPFVKVKVNELLFTGYEDTLLSAQYLLTQFIDVGDAIIPPQLAFFAGYNETNDGKYVIHTGVGDLDRIGDVLEWEGHSELPANWWNGTDARKIIGSDGCQIRPPLMDETRTPDVFLTYWCRSFQLEYSKMVTVRGAPGIRFNIPQDVFNVSAPRNRQFVDPNATALPDGLMSIPCQPGKRIEISLPVIYSAPHFLDCDPAALNAVVMDPPDRQKHAIGHWVFEPTVGYPIEIVFRQQVSVPFKGDQNITLLSRTPTLALPLLWIMEDVAIDDVSLAMVMNIVVLLPLIGQISCFVLLILGILIVLLCLAWPYITKNYCLNSKKVAEEEESESEMDETDTEEEEETDELSQPSTSSQLEQNTPHSRQPPQHPQTPPHPQPLQSKSSQVYPTIVHEKTTIPPEPELPSAPPMIDSISECSTSSTLTVGNSYAYDVTLPRNQVAPPNHTIYTTATHHQDHDQRSYH